MNVGDKVTGTPLVPELRKKHPTVVGQYRKKSWTFLGEKHVSEFIDVGGEWISCDNIKAAGRRDKETVFS